MSENSLKWSIIGNKTIVDYLQKSVLADNLAHAYLFFGPDGVGKKSLVENFIRSIFCESNLACGKCGHCIQIKNTIHSDITWIERGFDDKTGKPKKNISIEQIREVQSKLSLRSFLNSYKVAVVNGAESLSEEAANSLLKVLEEPAEKTILILIAVNLKNIPETIISRCQTFEMLPVAQSEIVSHLEDLGADKKKSRQIAAAAYGRPGLAIEYFKNVDFYEEYKGIARDFTKIHQVSLLERFSKIGEINAFTDPGVIRKWLDVWSKILRDIILTKNNISGVIGNTFIEDEVKVIAKLYNNKKLAEVLREVELAKTYLYGNVNPKLILENLILRLPS